MKIKDKMNKKYTLISIYVIITAIIIYILTLLAKNAPTIYIELSSVVGKFLKIVKPIVLGFVFAYLVTPVVEFFEGNYLKIKWVQKKPKRARTLAVVTTCFLVVLALAFIISMLVYSVTDQIKLANFDDIILLCNEFIDNINEFSKQIIAKLNSLNIESIELSQYISSAGTEILRKITSFGSSALSSVKNISGYLTTIVFAIIISIYFLLDGKMVKSYLDRITTALFNKKANKTMRNFITDADTVFSGYIRGQLMDAFVMMVLISLVLSIVGVKFSIIIGILAGVGNLIPYCGPFVAYAGTILVCLINGQYSQMIMGVILLFIVQAIDGNIIGPKLLSQSIQIHPLLIIIFLIFGSSIGGLMGMLLAVPVGAFLKLLFMRFIDRRIVKKEKEEAFAKANNLQSENKN